MRLLQLQRSGAGSEVHRALEERPQDPWAWLLHAWILLCSRDVRDFEAAGWAYARLTRMRLDRRQAAHLGAIAAAVDADYGGASRRLDAWSAQEPRDFVALWAAHVIDYFLGLPSAQLHRSDRAVRAWSADDPGYHAVLSLHAFALEECGQYDEAEAIARRALELEPGDLRAHHVVAHVMEMQGRAAEGIRWMGSRAAHWTGSGEGSNHLWWHLALYHLELDRPALALEAYDRRMQAEGLAAMIDASALLWRMHLAGYDVGARLRTLAARWAPHAADAHCAFNDLHAAMAFAGAQRWDCMDRLLEAQQARLARGGDNRDMTRLVGLPASRALAAFGKGDYALAESLLRSLPPVAHRVGGSHAQRDVLTLTRAAAAQRRGMRRAA